MTSDARGQRTPLALELAERIATHGPISVAAYMEACLNDRQHGYYRSRAAIGREGDFITAPEISQTFGELIGLWCAIVWQQMGISARINLVEIGPGRGTLMRDAMRAARIVPGFHKALHLHLIDSNTSLVAEQRATLGESAEDARWHADLAQALMPGGAIEDHPMILVANEFLDTLPVEQIVYRDGGWHARCVGLDANGDLAFVVGEETIDPPSALAAGLMPKDGDVFEWAPGVEDLVGLLAARAAPAPLAALFIDYGHVATGLGDTLQAVAAHTHVSPLLAPGEMDLSTQVDFARFAAACTRSGLAVDGPAAQAEFLGALGIVERGSHLMAANPQKAGGIEMAIARLIAPGGMGSRFHAIGIRTVNVGPLPGLTAVDKAPRPA